MMKMTSGKMVWFLLCVGMISSGLGGVAAGAEERETIRIGLLGTFQVRMGVEMQGNDMRDGALLALEQARNSDKFRGRSFELVVANDRGDPQQAVLQAKRLIEVEKVAAILGPSNSSCALAVAPVVSAARIPMITLATHPALTEPVQRYIFRGNMSDRDLGKIMVDYVMIMLGGGGEKVAILHEDTPYGQAGMEVVSERMRRHGAKPVAIVSYPSGKTDYSEQMKQLKQSGAKIILVYGTMVDAQVLMQWIVGSNLGARVVASSGWESYHLLATVPMGLDGVVVAGYAHLLPDQIVYLGPPRIVLSPIAHGHYQVVTGDIDADQFPTWAAFYKDFRSRYRRNPDLIAGYTYSNLLCLLEAMARVNFDLNRIVEGLEATQNFPTVFEHFLNYHDQNHDGMRYINFSTYREGRVEMAAKDKSLDATKIRERGFILEANGFRGEISPMPPNAAAFFVLHMGFGYPLFMKEIREMGLYGGFRSDYEFHGMKYAFSGTLTRGEEKIMVVKMAYRSPELAIATLDLEASKEALGDKTKVERRPEEMRNADQGISYAGGEWSAYRRQGSTLVFAKGYVSLEDLLAVVDAAF
jgi:branched-chain amino acid transport system substrate-binding protein